MLVDTGLAALAGEEVVLVGARSKVPMVVGNAILDAPWVYFQRSGREEIKIENWDPPIDGLIGNVMFVDYLVAIDIGGERIGLRRVTPPTP